MEYITIVRGYNEPDNNTPSSEVFVKAIKCEPSRLSEYEATIVEEFSEDYPIEVEVVSIPLDEIREGWKRGATIW